MKLFVHLFVIYVFIVRITLPTLASCSIQWKYSKTATGDADILYYDNSIFTANSRAGRIVVQAPYNLLIETTVQSDSGVLK